MAKRAFETHNWDYFVSEAGTPNTTNISLLSLEHQKIIQSSLATKIELEADAHASPLHTPQQKPQIYSPTPLAQFPLPPETFKIPQSAWQTPSLTPVIPDQFEHEMKLHRAKLLLTEDSRLRQEKGRREREGIMAAVPLFDRQRTRTFLLDWLAKFTKALDTDFGDRPDYLKVEYLMRKSSAVANEWLKTLQAPANVTIGWYIDHIMQEHMPQNDERVARKALRALRFGPYGQDPSSFDRFTAEFDAFLPRVPEMDRLTLLETFELTLGAELYLEIAKHTIGTPNPGYVDFKTIGRKLWHNGGLRSSKPGPTKAPSTMQSAQMQKKITDLMKDSVQVNRVDMRNWTQEQKDLYRKKACFNCHKPGHFSAHCKVDPASTTPATPSPPPVTINQITTGDESDFRYAPSNNSLVNAPMTSPLAEPDTAYLNKLLVNVTPPRLVPDHVRLDLYKVAIATGAATHTDKARAWEQQMNTNREKAGTLPFTARLHHYRQEAHKPTSIQTKSVDHGSLSIETGSTVPLVAGAYYRFHLPAILAGSTQANVLADSGSQGMFMGFEMAQRLGLTPKPLSWTQDISYANPALGEQVNQYVTCRVDIGSYWKDLNFMLANMGDSVILGVSWFNTLRFTTLDWANFSIRFIDKLTDRHHNLDSIFQPTYRLVNKTPLLKRIAWKELERIHKSCISIERISIRQLAEIDIAAIDQEQRQASTPPDSPTHPLIKQYPSVFSPQVPFPPERPAFDMKIPLDASQPTPPIRRLGKRSAAELEILKERIQELLERGFIRPSTSEFGAQVLFVKKSDGSLRLCVDYRGLNSISIKNRSPLPSIAEMRNRLEGARFFSKLDLRDGYYNLRMAADDIHKTAFKCRYGHFEFTVVPFGLTNAPGVFSSFMNHILRDVLDIFVISYLDDILIFSKTEAEHQQHVTAVLDILKSHQLCLKASKCALFQTQVEFCGHFVGRNGLAITPSKIKAMQVRPHCKNIHDLQKFLGSAVWFHDFIMDFAAIAEPLTRLLSPKVPWHWGMNRRRPSLSSFTSLLLRQS